MLVDGVFVRLVGKGQPAGNHGAILWAGRVNIPPSEDPAFSWLSSR